MTKRIFGGAFIVSLVAIISAVAMVLGVAYTKEQQLFKRQLEQQAMLLAATKENTSPTTMLRASASSAMISMAHLRTA